MSVEAQLNALIKKLEDARDDAQKCDKGRAGAPGTRLRKVASEVRDGLSDLRKTIIDARSASPAAE
jgi:hypothetical protein